MKIQDLYKKFKTCSVISTDTRKLAKDCMYFALKGDNFDGHKFVQNAFNGGAKFCVIDNRDSQINDNCILVKDTLKTLQDLATYHRQQINIPIISLTGSNGKTTTKELINVVLKTTYNVQSTLGNLNNHIGVPLTLLSFTEDLDFGIVEMGANHLKEIEFLCKIAQPNYGLITNFGKAHLEGFGSIDGVIKAKSELYDYIKSHDGTVFINSNDNKQKQQIGHYSNIITFGDSPTNDCVVAFKNADPYVNLSYNARDIKSQLIGDYNYGNIAAAVAIGKHFNVKTEAIKKAIENYQPDNNRSEIIKKGNIEIILDAYNANPTSMLAALKNFKQLNAENKYIFIGDMFELGEEAKTEHQNIVQFLESNFQNNIFIIGENFYSTKAKPFIQKFANFNNLKETLESLEINDASILIKGSRGMALERILNHLKLN
ncbi:UDP-N-acetylmuramoyl-tripeptide--D-alanyl-D-alanine ligase [Winogradskyella wichelsiae]|uniref:UDP-N-acetylmuramoyl-tripeptide--D-alanyl-D- alanine ligase n=1 Tax=Winogradskyella wichelsiae TaxID=2697007 RepID=UPI0015C6B753|nr:UDP-N-acetylmuramoyl-tripeptide--D-alanyl-D-alanine ligase [Winogradskyella wichelsiae]